MFSEAFELLREQSLMTAAQRLLMTVAQRALMKFSQKYDRIDS
jgi:hypothetical protein